MSEDKGKTDKANYRIAFQYRMIDEEKPDYLAVAFDLHAPTFRHRTYDAYKAGRPVRRQPGLSGRPHGQTGRGPSPALTPRDGFSCAFRAGVI